MSRSKNVRSRYQTVPDHIRTSLTVRDSGDNRRSRDLRGRERHDVRVFIETILQDSADEQFLRDFARQHGVEDFDA